MDELNFIEVRIEMYYYDEVRLGLHYNAVYLKYLYTKFFKLSIYLIFIIYITTCSCLLKLYNTTCSFQNIHHHYRAYGGWTWAFHDYYDLNFTATLDDPCTHNLFEFIDPISQFVYQLNIV